jgi:hypothetical protein
VVQRHKLCIRSKFVKTGEIATGRLSKVVGDVLPLSKENCSSAIYLPDFKTGKITPCWFSKALGATPRRLLSVSSKRFELAGFEKLAENAKWLRTC